MAKAKRKTLREALDEATTELAHVTLEQSEFSSILEHIQRYMDDQYTDNCCLHCPDDGHFDAGLVHSDANPGCWVKEIDKLLCPY